MEREPRIEHEEARELWRRAAELQLAAEKDAHQRAALAPVESDGLSLEQVTEAARGAGIDPDFLAMALAERRLPDGELIRRDRWTARWLRRMVQDADELHVSAVFRAAPAAVLQAFRSVAATPAFHMAHEETLGSDPVQDGVLVFRLESATKGGWSAGSTFHGELEMADARVVLVMIRPDGEDTRLRLRAPLFRRGMNLAIATGLTGGLGGAGSAAGGAAGATIAGMIGTASVAVLAAPAVLGALVGGAVGYAGFTRLYRWGTRSGDTALQRLIRAVRLELESQPSQ